MSSLSVYDESLHALNIVFTHDNLIPFCNLKITRFIFVEYISALQRYFKCLKPCYFSTSSFCSLVWQQLRENHELGKCARGFLGKFFDVMRCLKLRILNSALRGFYPVSLSLLYWLMRIVKSIFELIFFYSRVSTCEIQLHRVRSPLLQKVQRSTVYCSTVCHYAKKNNKLEEIT